MLLFGKPKRSISPPTYGTRPAPSTPTLLRICYWVCRWKNIQNRI